MRVDFSQPASVETRRMPQDQRDDRTADDELARSTPDVVTESLVLRLARRTHTIDYQAGDTVLEAARRVGLSPPFSCEAGNCATCLAHLDEGSVRMRANNALTPEEVDEGWVLTCQSLPTSRVVIVDYDA